VSRRDEEGDCESLSKGGEMCREKDKKLSREKQKVGAGRQEMSRRRTEDDEN